MVLEQVFPYRSDIFQSLLQRGILEAVSTA